MFSSLLAAAARPKEKLELSSTLVAGFSLGKYRKMERESELCIYVGVVKKKAVIGDGKIIPIG